MAYACENCKFRAHYDAKPTSALGRFWHWHINFCPGWKAYFTSRSAEEQKQLREKYCFLFMYPLIFGVFFALFA